MPETKETKSMFTPVEPAQENDALKTYLVTVHKTGVPEEEYKIPITVNTCSHETGGKREFFHGQQVRLTKTQLEILNNAVKDSRMEFPSGSGIYQHASVAEQIAAAQAEMPGYSIERNPSNGSITAVMHKRRFHIDYHEDNPFIKKAA